MTHSLYTYENLAIFWLKMHLTHITNIPVIIIVISKYLTTVITGTHNQNLQATL